MAQSSNLGHFNLLEEIGQGGMGTVFKAFDPSLNRHVAIKVLNDKFAQDPKFLEDFLREARHAAGISHPHIVQVFFVGEADGRYYVVMELLTGHPLLEIIERDGPLAEERALQIAGDVAEALRAAYQQSQLIHGDIKPANIFLTTNAGAKVLDFGLAKLTDVEAPTTGEIWGSPYYISPERVGRRAEDFRSDIYSLGATLFHAVTGRPPFEAGTPEELALKRLNERPPLVRELRPELTAETEQVVAKMLSKSPLTRYRDYDHLLEHLGGAKTAATARRLGIQVTTGAAPAEPEPAVLTAPPPRKSRWGLLAIVGFAVVAAGAGAALWLRRPPPTVAPAIIARPPRPEPQLPVKPVPAPAPAPVPTPSPAPPPAPASNAPVPPSPPVDTQAAIPLANVTRDLLNKEITVKATILEIQEPRSERAPYVITLAQDNSRLPLVLWKDVHEQIKDKLKVGTVVEVHAVVIDYQGTLELKLLKPRLEALREQQQQVTGEIKLIQAGEPDLAPAWQNYDFLAVVAHYQTLAAQLTTPVARRAVEQRLSNAKLLADFKTQLSADIALQPYERGDLLTRGNAPLAGRLVRATDTELTFATQYGELGTPWADLSPPVLLNLAKVYAASLAPAETPDMKARRSRMIAAFAKQYAVTPPPQPKPTQPKPSPPPPPPKPPKMKPQLTK